MSELKFNYSKKQKKNRILCTITFDGTNDVQQIFSETAKKVVSELSKQPKKD